jgi:GPH family glycoside/pentoside/hexuronide:cation symporter
MIEKKPMTKPVRWLWAIGDAGFAAVVMIQTNYLAPFLTDYAKYSLAVVGVILVLCNALDTVGSLIAGVFIEKGKMPWGKYRSWLLVGGFLVFVFNILQYTRISQNEIIAAVVVVVGAGLGRTFWNVTFTADTGMIPILADSTSDLNFLMARRQMWQYVGRLLFSISGVPLIGLFAGVINEYWAIFFVAVIFSSLMVIGWWIEFGLSKGYEGTEASGPVKTTKWVDMLKVMKNGPLWLLVIGAIFRDVAQFTCISFQFYYFRYVWNNLGAFGIYMTANSIASAAVTMFLAKHLLDKFGARKMWIISAFIAAGIYIIIRFTAQNAYFFIVGDVINRIFFASAMAVHPMLFTDVATYAEHKTGIEARGFILGLGNINTKVGVLIAGVILSSALVAIKFVPNVEQTVEAKSLLNSWFCLFPAFIYVIHALFMMFIYPLTDAKMTEIKNELAARKAAVPAV